MRWQGARVVYHGHGRDFYPADRFFVRSIDGMLSCSRYNAGEVAVRYGGQPAVVYNGFDPRHFSPRPPDPTLREKLVRPDERVILIAGRMQPWKGVQYAIEALPLVAPNVPVRLLIGGDGDFRSDLERLTRRLGLGERVSFLGTIPHSDLPAYFALADVVVGASFASETFGMVLCEALGCARPVIASDWEGYREVVIPDETGMVVPARHPAALAMAIDRMLADPEGAQALAERGRRHVLQQFTWDAVADRVEQLYDQVLGHR
jgi:glycosyltransferase involved in cell wall biosynthesis